MSVVACVDVGSTYTKAALVDTHTGKLHGTVEHPTTRPDVLVGLDTAVADLGGADEVLVCSSAGGGLRLAVVGYERLVTAQAGARVGLSAGARVVHVSAGPLDAAAVRALRAARPDVVLLVGGTDGGDAEVLVHNARRLAVARLRVPVVVAGNIDARDEAMAALTARGVPAAATDNVLPRIGELRCEPARAAIREVFLRHVIGGKGLSRGPRFASLVRAATPDAVLTGVQLLAEQAGAVLVIDVGGATTDVYSVLAADNGRREVAGSARHYRTVEGDLGVRSSAPGVLAAAYAERLLSPEYSEHLSTPDAPHGTAGAAGPVAGGRVGQPDWPAAVAARAANPAMLPVDEAGRELDVRLAALAAVVAVRRHARGRDLGTVNLVVASGGVLRHAEPHRRTLLLDAVLSDVAGGWALPEAPRRVVDVRYVLATAGLLAAEYPPAASRLLRDWLLAE